jgi:hypothetical protein
MDGTPVFDPVSNSRHGNCPESGSLAEFISMRSATRQFARGDHEVAKILQPDLRGMPQRGTKPASQAVFGAESSLPPTLSLLPERKAPSLARDKRHVAAVAALTPRALSAAAMLARPPVRRRLAHRVVHGARQTAGPQPCPHFPDRPHCWRTVWICCRRDSVPARHAQNSPPDGRRVGGAPEPFQRHLPRLWTRGGRVCTC